MYEINPHHNHINSDFPFEKIEPEIEQYLQRLFTSTELNILKQVWLNYNDILLTEKYLSKYFHVYNQKFENIININSSTKLQFTPGASIYHHYDPLIKELEPHLEILKLQFITQCFSPFALLISGILSISNQISHLNTIENIFSVAASEINPLGIPSYYGDIKFCENINHTSVLSLLGIGLCKNENNASKNNIILLISDKKDNDFATWAPSVTTPPNLYYHLRLKQFIKEANQYKSQIISSFPYKSNLYSSAFMFAHALQKGIILECEDIPPHYNQILISCEAEFLDQVESLTNKWQLEYHKIGKAIHERTFKIKINKHDLAELPLHTISILLKHIEINEKTTPAKTKHKEIKPNHFSEPGDYRDTAWNLLTNPNLKSKDWLMEKFDSTVGTNNIHLNFPASSRILNLKGTDNAISLSAFSKPSFFKTDPEKGAYIAVAEMTRKILCSGGIPNILSSSFLMPYSLKNNEAEKLQHLIKGLYAAARYFSLQISKPSISFVDTTKFSEIDFPVVNLFCTGIIENKKHITTLAFKNKGDMIFLIGESVEDTQSSLYLQNYYQVDSTHLPHFKLQEEFKIQECIKKLVQHNLIRSANVVSTGGLIASLIESAIIRNHGFDITTDAEIRKDSFLFGEAQSRIIVSVTPHHEAEFIDLMIEIGVPFSALGHVTKEEIRIDDISYGFVSDFQKEFFTSPKQ